MNLLLQSPATVNNLGSFIIIMVTKNIKVLITIGNIQVELIVNLNIKIFVSFTYL